MGERQSLILERRGGKVVAAVLAMAAMGAGVAWFAHSKGAATPATPVAAVPAAPPALEPPPERAAPKEVTLRVTSIPAGVQVLDGARGDVLGVTPLSFKRPRGGALKLRLEKEGYVGAAQEVTLDSDQQLEFALARQEAPKAKDKDKDKVKAAAKTKHHSHEDEPAKL